MRRSGDRPTRDRDSHLLGFGLGSAGSLQPSPRRPGLGFGKGTRSGSIVKQLKSRTHRVSVFSCHGRLSVWTHVATPSVAYAEKAEAEKSEAAFRFNCAQRKSLSIHVFVRADVPSLGAHANTLESIPYVITMSVHWLEWIALYSLTFIASQGVDLGS